MSQPFLAFASPRKLPNPDSLEGRVVVLDIAFAADGIGPGFAKTTGKFITRLGDRLARWVDHHDHPAHTDFASDERFVLATKAQHGACPEMITPDIVRDTGPVDTILCHFDLDGLYSAAKWILGGQEPYEGADDDARAVDTRIGEASSRALRVDKALRAHWTDHVLKQRVVNWLVEGCRPGVNAEAIDAAARDFEARERQALLLAAEFEVEPGKGIAMVSVPSTTAPFDKTELLLEGQKLATVAVVIDAGNVSIAASFESGLNFVELLDLGGGMPTRVNIPEKRLGSALRAIREELQRRG